MKVISHIKSHTQYHRYKFILSIMDTNSSSIYIHNPDHNHNTRYSHSNRNKINFSAPVEAQWTQQADGIV